MAESTLDELLYRLWLQPRKVDGHSVRVYASNAPSWWFYHVVTPGKLPPKGAKSVVLDNGAFTYYRNGAFPSIDVWVARLFYVARLASSRAEEVIVVLPDKPLDPDTTLKWHREACKKLCRDNLCAAVAHFPRLQPRKIRDVVEELLSLDVQVLAIPLKLPCNKSYSNSARRTQVDLMCQVRACSEAYEVARKYGVRLHALAPRKDVVPKIWTMIDSFDTTSWTRLPTKLKKLLRTISVRNDDERGIAFIEYLESLTRKGVKLESWAS